MKRITCVVALMVVASAAVLIAAGPVGSQPQQQRGAITMFDPNATDFERFIDRGRQGISPGDTILFSDTQFDPETCDSLGKLVGRLQIVKNVGRENALFIGDFTVNLADGKITVGGSGKFSEFDQADPVFAVTGGTEAYRDASGDVSFQEETQMCGKRGTLTTIDVGPTP